MLTITEEAQTRALIAQNAAILSLAASEPSIISKLAATKVSLADLSPAVSLGDSDLFLVRQGLGEKSVSTAVLKTDVLTGLDASEVGYMPAGVGAVAADVQTKLREISVSLADFGGVEDGITEDSAAFTKAVAALPNGGTILIKGTPLIGGVTIATEGIRLDSHSPTGTYIVVKSGTLGILVTANWVSLGKIKFKSQGTKTDGLNTRGIRYEKTPVNSIGFAEWDDVTFNGFSGYGGTVINAINFVYRKGYAISCITGVSFDRDAGAVLFGTTTQIDDFYATSCTTGLKTNYLYRSRINMIGEYCDYGLDANAGEFTLGPQCYFENNFILGARIVNAAVRDLNTYSNNTVTDAVSITFTGAVAAADRGYVKMLDFDFTAKRMGILSNYGVDPKYFAAYGDTANVGVTYGSAVVPIVRGANLADPAAWVSNRSAEFQGWNAANQGYKVQGTTAGDTTYGIKQDVTLSTASQYIIDVASTTVSGSGITLIKCGATTVTNGVPFTPPVNGTNIIKAYGLDTLGTPFECYINAFQITEVLINTRYTSIAQKVLTAKQPGRGIIHAAASPVAGYWAVGEIVYNSAPTAGGTLGWVCTTAGTPGTWKTFGAISA